MVQSMGSVSRDSGLTFLKSGETIRVDLQPVRLHRHSRPSIPMTAINYPFYATNEDDFVSRLDHFVNAAPAYVGTIAALTTTAIAGVSAFADFLGVIRANGQASADYGKGLTQTKRLLFSGPSGGPAAQLPASPALTAAAGITAGQLDKLRSLLAQVTADPNYTKTIGADLGTEPPTRGPVANAGPTLVLLKALAEQVTIKWNKGRWKGVAFQGRVAGTLEWTDLGTDLYSPFVDARQLATAGRPETREYRACYLDKDTPTNVWSPVLVVTVTV